ncbi:MAG: AAA family ATPase [Tissierellia bacterium]|nr:AAA family ATPase [Tissierellia bacterium]
MTQEQKERITADRIQFSKEYLEKIRNAGLNAVAITDHHDVVSVKTIRKVSEEENQAFIASSQYEKVIKVFPGIELSLSNPASQCIIIFDSDFSDANLDSVLNFLGINPTNEFEKFTIETHRISQDIIHDLLHLHRKLDELTYCKGKYIILPNVGNGSQHSILRQGFHEHYRKMPCSGGYVDKAISSDSGYLNKIDGGDVNYGNKSIALISTSDNRFEDGREFGKYSTWIKWAEPTAEAIRQACLAKESRISQVDPELPQIFIRSIDVTTSKFLGTFNINLNRQYNALIGGRGTGKSTILEYLRWGLCDQTIQNSDYDELSIIEKRRNALIQKTLTEVNGEVRITMEKNGILHIVKRNSKSREILLKIGDREFQQVKEDDIRKILPIQSYSQKQLSDVGVKTEELKRFIEQPITNQLDTIKFKLSETATKFKNSYNQLIRKKEIEQEIENFNLESQSLNNQAENIRKSLKGISAEDQEIINKKPKFEKEETTIANSKNELVIFENKVDELLRLLEKYPEPLGDIEQLENKELIQNISTEIDNKFEAIKSTALALKAIFNAESLAKLNHYIDEWNQKKTAFEVAYEQAKNKSQSSQQQLTEIQKIEKRLSEISKIISDRKLLLKEIGTPETDFSLQQDNWKKFHAEKILLLNEQAIKFTELSKNLIKAEVTKSINLQPLKSQLKNIFEGTRIREEKIDSIVESIKQSNDPIKEYTSILEEFRLLAELKVSEDKTLAIPETPILSNCGFSVEHKSKLCAKISTDDWLRLSVNELEFNPEFFYTTNNQLGDVIPFREASAGQQATALLTVLLNQPGIPLLIDQPEDDIDNRAIDQIIKNIWDAKKKRQLIFTSHNANLVVNGDAELVICCDYKDSTSQTRGIIKEEGAIDKKVIRGEITAVMEGGEKAFKLRKDKYGF